MRGVFPDGVSRQDLMEAIAKFNAGERQGFGESTDYDLLMPDGRRYPPKAIAGIAATRVAGRLLSPEDFSAGEGQKCFRVLLENGFQIVAKNGVKGAEPPNSDWTDDELRAAIHAYLEMLRFEQSGQPYVKSRYNTQLRGGILEKRSNGSVEFRMQNISATLDDMGLPCVSGYKPRGHVGEGVKRRILGLLVEVAPQDYEPFLPSSDESQITRQARIILKSRRIRKPLGKRRPKLIERASIGFERSPAVRAFVLQEAAGICELCCVAAPFVDSEGVPFLEVHHVTPLAEGGPDTVENAVAVCPNCHRRLHHSIEREDARMLLSLSVTRLF